MVTSSFGIEPGRRVQYIPLVEKALELSSHKPSKVLVYNRPNMVRKTSARDAQGVWKIIIIIIIVLAKLKLVLKFRLNLKL